MLEHRLQIPLDDARYQKVVAEADRRRVSVPAIVREAFGLLPSDLDRRREAIGTILAADPIEVPAEPSDLRRELDEAFDRRVP